jgi:zinc transport system substrate-binding protein
MRGLIAALGLLILGAWLGLISAGCDRRSPTGKAADRVTVVATVYPLADVARQVGGAYVDTTWVLESGQSLRGFVPGPETRARLRSVNLVLMGGPAEQWAAEGFGDPSQGRRIIRLDAMNPGDTQASRQGYLWLDPRLVIDASRELCARLQVLRPTLDRQLKAQTDEFVQKLDEITREYQSKLAGAHAKKVMVLGPDFEPLLTRFGYVPVPTIEASPMQITEAQLKTIVQIAKDNDTRLLLVPADTPTLNIRDLEVRGGLQLVAIDGLGNSGATGRSTYLEILRYDLEQLLAATTVQ